MQKIKVVSTHLNAPRRFFLASYIIATIISLGCVQNLSAYPEKAITIVVPSHNNAQWCEQNLQSILDQNYKNFEVIYIDDCSTDATAQKAQSYISKHQQGHRVKFIKNAERKGGMRNLYESITALPDHRIVMEVDGDDWLADKTVLSAINKWYWQYPVWVTYGQYREYPSGNMGSAHEYPDDVIDNRVFRNYYMLALHPHTFYAGLFKQINRDDLMYRGLFLEMTWDQAFTFPMLEMAGRRHFLRGSEVLYIYNRANPNNDDKVSRSRQLEFERIVRARCRYSLLNEAIMETIIKESEQCAQ